MSETAEETQETTKRRPKDNGDYRTTTISLPVQLAREMKRICVVNGTTQVSELNKAIENHVARTKNSQEYKQRLQALLAE